MGKKKTTETVATRASVSRERRLALALRAVLDALADVHIEDNVAILLEEQAAVAILNDLGYSTLIGIPKRIKTLNEQLTTAVAAGDGKEIARLGLELERAKAGKVSLAVTNGDGGE
jgi:hypothetical protein